jgi:hypothetical protein
MTTTRVYRAMLAGIAIMLTGCQTNRSDGYAGLVNRPLPQTEGERNQECAWLRSEVARQQSVAQLAAERVNHFETPG